MKKKKILKLKLYSNLIMNVLFYSLSIFFKISINNSGYNKLNLREKKKS